METSQAVRSTTEVANRLVEICRQGRFDLAQQELYSDNARSIEPEHTNYPVAVGREAIEAKGKLWQDFVAEIHGSTVSEPIVAGDHFSIAMVIDATYKSGGRNDMKEICVYQVKDGLIVLEQFFY